LVFSGGGGRLLPGGLEFGGGVEFQFGVVLACDLQHPFAFGKEHRVVFAVEGYGCRFAPDELLELLLVVAGYPERLVVAERRVELRPVGENMKFNCSGVYRNDGAYPNN